MLMPRDNIEPIKLFVVYHNPDILKSIPQTDIIQGIDSNRTDGIHIANRTDYCELRAHYWVWKNLQMSEDDYVGFFQFRRYLDCSVSAINNVSGSHVLPYRIVKVPDIKCYQPDQVFRAVGKCDIIAPVWEYTGLPVWKRYATSSGHRKEDLDLICKIIERQCPEYLTAAEQYLCGAGEYYGNLYIMRRQYFDQYCEWIFSLLFEFDHCAVSPLPRTDGYLAERLFGIWFRHMQSRANICCGELPRLNLSFYDDEHHHLKYSKLINHFLPPGSKIRGVIRSWLQ